MTDIILGEIAGRTLIFRDTDGEGDYDRGESFAFGGGARPLDESDARRALRQIGISGFNPGARMQRVAAYVDCLRVAEREIGRGNYLGARHELDEAQRIAFEAHFEANRESLAALRWRAIEIARIEGAPGIDELREPGFKSKTLLSALQWDNEAGERNGSAALVLDYLNACRNRDTVRERGLSRERAFLSQLERDSARLRSEILLRGRRLQSVKVLGIEETRTTLADQMNIRGVALHIGDRVFRPASDGEGDGEPFVIARFEIHASYILALGKGGERGSIDFLQPARLRPPSPTPAASAVARAAPDDRRHSWILSAIRRVLNAFSF